MERGEVVAAKRTHRVHRSMAEKRRIVELTVLVGTYNMHTRMCQALKIDPQK